MTKVSKKRTRGRPKTFDRARTLDVALDCYWRDGVEVSVNAICRRAAVSKPGLYREFGGEDQLMAEVVTHYIATVLAPGMAMMAEDRPFQETLDGLVGFMTRPAEAGVPVGCLIAKMRGSHGRLGPVTRSRVEQLRQHAIAGYSAWLKRSEARGEVVLTVPLEVAARYVEVQAMMLLDQMAAGEDRATIRMHATLAFAALNAG